MLADVEISPTHLQRLSERIGEEWVEVRDEEVEKFRKAELERTYKEPPKGATAVMLDGGRLQARAEGAGRGVSEASWRESKVACCLTLDTKAQAVDPPGRGVRGASWRPRERPGPGSEARPIFLTR